MAQDSGEAGAGFRERSAYWILSGKGKLKAEGWQTQLRSSCWWGIAWSRWVLS